MRCFALRAASTLRAGCRRLLPAAARGGDRRLGRHRGLVRRRRAAAAPGAGRGTARLRLAVGADLPRRLDRLAAGEAALLELALAVRAAQVVALDLVVAVRAELVVEVRQPRLGRG